MAAFFLYCTAKEESVKYATAEYCRLQRLAGRDAIGRHVVCDDPEHADYIVFVGSSEPAYRDVRSCRLYKTYRGKSALIHSGDQVATIIPGLYASLDSRWLWSTKGTVQSTGYPRVAENDSLDIPPLRSSHSRYLYSFVGNARNHPVRGQILELIDDAAFLESSADKGPMQTDGAQGVNKERGRLYRDVMMQSKFVLCPRGKGSSSWRLFETMRAGRVPVVISDQWVPPPGPDWDRFSVRIAEPDVGMIPNRLRSIESEAEKMGERARREWDRHYAADVIFNSLMDQVIEVVTQARKVGKGYRKLPWVQVLQPHFIRHWYLGPALRYLRGT